MLEDLKEHLKRVRSEEAERERQRLAAQQLYDETLRSHLADYLPIIETFCQESGWSLEDHGVCLQDPDPRSLGIARYRCLHVFVAGPERSYESFEHSGTIVTGLHFFLWLDEGWLWRPPRLQCLAYCTEVPDDDRIFEKSWSGSSPEHLISALRRTYLLFG